MPVRDTPQSRQERRRQQRRQQVARQQRRQSTARRWFIIGGVLLLLLIGGGGAGAYFAFARGSQAGGAIDGISCQAEMLNYHIHAHLTLYQNGQPVVVPADVGIPANPSINVNGQNYCYYYLHTHAPSNVIHIESPTPRLYTLGQFFKVWHFTALWDAQSTLAAQAGIVVHDAFVNALWSARPSAIHAFVNGKPVSHYQDITLTDHELITLEIGTPLKPPATSFDWKHWNGQ